jgi:hypothetical protein
VWWYTPVIPALRVVILWATQPDSVSKKKCVCVCVRVCAASRTEVNGGFFFFCSVGIRTQDFTNARQVFEPQPGPSFLSLVFLLCLLGNLAPIL